MYSVIIVEDEQSILDGIIELIDFKTYGFEICGTAKNGAEALKLINTMNPHLVITDIKMPVMDGITLLENIRKEFSHIKTIVLTGYDDFEYIKKIMNLGAVGYVSKLTMFEELDDVLKRVFEEISHIESTRLLHISNYRNDIINQFLHYNQGNKFPVHSNHLPAGKWVCSAVILLDSDLKTSSSSTDVIMKLFESVEVENEIISTQLKNNLFAIVFFSDTENNNLINACTESIKSTFKNFNHSISLFIGIGNWYKNSDYCGHSIAEAQIALVNRKLFRGEAVVYYKNLRLDEIKDYEESFNQLLSSTINAIDSKDYKYIRHDVLNTINTLFNTSKNFDRTRKNYFTFLSVLVWKLESFSNDKAFFENVKYDILELDSISEPMEFKTRLIDIILHAIEPLSDISTANNEQRIQMICNYIDTHIYENITLPQMSTFAYMTQSYLSTLFKKYTGTTFSDYVTNKKMMKSFELLKEGHTVSYVSQMIGYAEIKNFRHMFKKIHGFNPSEIKNDQSL